MPRLRVVPPETTVYPSVEAFLNQEPTSGFHAVPVNGQWIDLHLEDRGLPATLVGFHASLPAKVRTLPAFSGGLLAREADLNYVGISDPSLVMGNVDLAWYLGNAVVGALPPVLSPLIRHLVGTTKPILFGASGGGYAAVLYAKEFPGCFVLGANPRLNMNSKPQAKLQKYATVCHYATNDEETESIRSTFVTENLASLYSEGLPFNFTLLQNEEDQDFLEGQALPFLSNFQGDPRIEYIPLQNGPGHNPVPRTTLVKHLKRIGKASLRA